MSTVSRGFKGRRERPAVELPPGQYLLEDFPVLSAGPTPDLDLADWELVITSETGDSQRWAWAGFRALASEPPTVDLHCVTHWSNLATAWEGCRWTPCWRAGDQRRLRPRLLLRRLFHQPAPGGPDRPPGLGRVALRRRRPGGRAWWPGPAAGGHLYFWKSAKWVRGIQLGDTDEPGFWESLGYHHYGDPWHEHRFWGD